MSGLKARQRQRDYHRLQLMVIPSPKKGQQDLHVHGRTLRDRIANLVTLIEQKQLSLTDLKHLHLDARNLDLRGIKLRALGPQVLRQGNFSGADLSGQDFSRMNLTGFIMPGAKANGTRFDNSKLDNAVMDGAQLHRASFYQVAALGIKLNRVQACDANWEGVFRGCQAYQADMRFGWFSEQSDFDRGTMAEAKLDGARSVFGAPFMTNTNLAGASLKGNFSAWNFSGANLNKADATGSIMEGTNFIGADVTGMLTTGANLARVKLQDAKDLEIDMEMKQPTPSFGWANNYRTLKAMASLPEPKPAPTVAAENDNEAEAPARPIVAKTAKPLLTLDYAA
jgi:uncharacterized protein YjbI with pentapeptide repeats